MVKAVPTAAFEVAETKLLFELLVVASDAPAQLGEAYQFVERSAGRQGNQEVFGRFGCIAPSLRVGA